jgi:O-antigen ligase
MTENSKRIRARVADWVRLRRTGLPKEMLTFPSVLNWEQQPPIVSEHPVSLVAVIKWLLVSVLLFVPLLVCSASGSKGFG